jgi:hypothetical protein
MIIYFVWSIILTVHRETVVGRTVAGTAAYAPAQGTTMNPVQQMHDVRVNDDEEI